MQWHTGETRAGQTRSVHGKVCIDQVSELRGQGSSIGRIEIDTPYPTGDVEALCSRDAIYDLIIGNVPNAKDPNNPRVNQWEAGALPRAASKRTDWINPLVTSTRKEWVDIDRRDYRVCNRKTHRCAGTETKPERRRKDAKK